MTNSLTIGDFSRATHLTVKTLRHYHETGLLLPTHVDPQTGYRRYATEQIQTAQIIRRFRDLDMPLNEILAVLSASDVDIRNELISAHLRRLEDDLARTQTAVASLRDLLQHPGSSAEIKHRKVAAIAVAAITEVLQLKDALAWFSGAFGELHAALEAQRIVPTGPAGGVYSNALFSHARGEATVFLPCDKKMRAVGRVAPLDIPAVELATVIHEGSHDNIDIAYGELATYVTKHALAVDGPLREYYIVGRQETADASAWRTEVGWPIFATGA